MTPGQRYKHGWIKIGATVETPHGKAKVLSAPTPDNGHKVKVKLDSPAGKSTGDAVKTLDATQVHGGTAAKARADAQRMADQSAEYEANSEVYDQIAQHTDDAEFHKSEANKHPLGSPERQAHTKAMFAAQDAANKLDPRVQAARAEASAKAKQMMEQSSEFEKSARNNPAAHDPGAEVKRKAAAVKAKRQATKSTALPDHKQALKTDAPADHAKAAKSNQAAADYLKRNAKSPLTQKMAAQHQAWADAHAKKAKGKGTNLANELDSLTMELAVPLNLRARARAAAAKKGQALPDGSFPIRNRAQLVKAKRAIGRAKPSKRGKVKAFIAKRAKALGVKK